MAQKRNQSEDKKQPTNPATKAIKTGHIPPGKRQPFVIAIGTVIVAAASGNIFLKYGLSGDKAPSAQSLSQIPLAAWDALTNIWIDVAIISMVIEFIALIYALRIGPLSLVVPLRGGSTYIVTALLAKYFLGEQVSSQRWAALVIIFIGVTLIGLSGEKG